MDEDWEQGWEGLRWVDRADAGPGDDAEAAIERVPIGAVHAVSYTHWDDPGPYRTACGRWVALQFEDPFTEAGACAECVAAVSAGA